MAGLASLTKHMGAGVGRISNVILERGVGSWLYSVTGEKYLDMTSGIGVTSTGHCHPKVVAAANDQASKLIHLQVGVGYSTATLELMKTLLPLMPKGLDSFLFLNSGSEAIDNAVKLARHATGKPNVIVFKGGYHGRTLGAMSLTTSKTIYRTRFGPHMPGVFATPFPYCINCPAACATSGSCCNSPLDELKLLLKTQTAPEETCAVLVEPVLGEGGYVPMPPGFMAGLRKICDDNKLLLIADEVQTGFGRTGKMFAVDGHYNTVPDILVIAKGLASGYPIAALASRTDLTATQPPGSMGGTYTANPIACAAATATQHVIQEEGLVENSAKRGAQLKAGLEKLKGKFPIRDVRGLGLMIGVEFNKDLPYGTASSVSKACLEHNMFLLTTSVYETVRFIPSLNVTAEEIDLALDKFEKALTKVFAK
eukprot:m.226230 g.226230  ORF g.226230 m.226230 type:complete len:425 (+) comp16899_c0_seq1:22-1296(+)